MQDDAPSAQVAMFLGEAAKAFPAEPPTPGGELALLLAEGLPAPALTPSSPQPTRRSRMSSLPRKLAIAAAGLTFAGTGVAAASALPGVDLPGTEALPEVTTTLPDASTTLPDASTTLPEVSTTLPEVSTTLPDTSTTLPDTSSTTLPDVTTPTTTGTGALPPPATRASEAAKIRAFDEACGNHGQYVSYVARNGTEPACATGVRNGTASPTTGSTGGEAADESSKGAKPDNPGSKGGAPGNSGRKGR